MGGKELFLKHFIILSVETTSSMLGNSGEKWHSTTRPSSVLKCNGCMTAGLHCGFCICDASRVAPNARLISTMTARTHIQTFLAVDIIFMPRPSKETWRQVERHHVRTKGTSDFVFLTSIFLT